MTMPMRTVSVQLYRPVALALEARGVCSGRFFGELGVVPPAAAAWDARVPLARVSGLWDRLATLTGERHFSLDAAECLDLAMCDLVTSLAANAKTVSEALKSKVGYQALISDSIQWSLETGDETRLTLEPPAQRTSAPMSEFLLGAQQVLMRRFGPEGWRLSSVRFRHARPPSTTTHERVFGMEPEFGAASDELTFDGRLLAAPMPHRNDSVAELLERYAGHLLAELTFPESVASRVRKALETGVNPGISPMAAHLGIAVRTLQRKLADEGTSYNAIVNDTRRSAAERLLRRRKHSISEIAYTLGFGDVPAFHRAFVRWTGMTPGRFLQDVSAHTPEQRTRDAPKPI
jgi:AraC-like DNA-binding protein